MSKSFLSSKRTRVQKVCTLWTHDDNFSKDDVVFNGDKFPELPTTSGSLIQILALKHATAVRDFQTTAKSHSADNLQKIGELRAESHRETHSRRSRRGSVTVTFDENGTVVQATRDVDPEKSYIFVAKPLSADVKSKYPNLQISLSEKIAKVFGFRNRVQVVVREADEDRHSASHVEIAFRDEYLARADMWRMSIAELSNRTVYRGQNLLFMGTIKARVKNVYINGQSRHSGYFSPTTKPIFRSESARYVLFVQMSKEMWDFDTEGAGEIMFNKVVNGFLPDLFKRWLKIGARHLVTIILFTRMTYDKSPSTDRPDSTTNKGGFEKDSQGFRDYYRVVVSDMASGDWINILYQLKKEFRVFLREVSLVPRPSGRATDIDNQEEADSVPDSVISGEPTTASCGNILEAVNLAAAQFAKDYIDRDLVRTGISIVVITAGTGVFEVDYNMLKLTTDTLIGSGIGIDLVCLSPMPLHSVPLFKYKSPRSISSMKDAKNEKLALEGFNEQDDKTPRQKYANFGSLVRGSPAGLPPILPMEPIFDPHEGSDEWRYAMPHWLDISFWSGPSDALIETLKPKKSATVTKSHKKTSKFALRCRMYELQMMGVMENELGDICIPYLQEDPLYPHRLRQHLENLPPGTERESTGSALEGRFASSRPTFTDEQRDQTSALQKIWMDSYDDNVFSPLMDRRPHFEDSKRRNTGPGLIKRISPDHLPDETFLSASFRRVGPSSGKTARPTPEVNFDQIMRERSKEDGVSPRGGIYRASEAIGQGMPRADVMYRHMASKDKDPRRPSFHQRGNSGDSIDHRRSFQSTPNDSPAVSRGNTPPKRSGLPPVVPSPAPSIRGESSTRPANWFLRQISFGGRGAAQAKPTTGDITTVKVKPARLTVENNQKGAIAAKLASTKLTELETPSQPIAIRSASRTAPLASTSPTPENTSQSVETVKGIRTLRPSVPSQPGSVTKDPGSTFLLAGSRALVESIGPKLDLASSGGAKTVRRTLSPTSAIAPWAVLVNPCNPRKNTLNISNQFRRWQHIFPKRLKTSSVKWKSLCSPAAVPLTNEYFPSAEQLASEYNESPYKIAQNDDDDVVEAPKSRESLIRELIAFRLSHGFQIVVGAAVAEFTGGREQDLSNILHSDYMSTDGDTVFMSVGNTIHQLVCVAGGEVEVKRFTRKPTTALQSSAGIDTPFPYRPFIKTALEHDYHSRDVILRPPRKEYNWNFIDTFLAGYHDEFSDILRFWRARFVLIPVDIPTVNRRPLPLLPEDSEEEVRIEGIRKLTHVWQRHRYVTPDERQVTSATAKLKDPNPLAIEYHTRDPSAVVATGPEGAFLNDTESDFHTTLFAENEQYTQAIDMKKIAEVLQGEKGITISDRRWHWRLHYNCFLGFDLTTWLLANFRDIQTRDEAVEYGNKLMEKGLFQHVQKRHQFRDGNFFYQVATEYRPPRPDTRTSWFSMRKADRSVPSTPLSDGPRSSPISSRSERSRPSTGDSSSASGSLPDGEKTPTRGGSPKGNKVLLSRVMRYDVDPRRRSYRPELISLHYDRLHNPDNCYHLRIDWMNVTAKLIEDAIVTWATNVEKYGLKLVEVPIAEASNIIDYHPFRSPYTIKLALQPPQSQPDHVWDAAHFTAQAKPDKHAYHKALLRNLNFVLDMEAAECFPSDIDVSYSWGKPDYKYTQFIHRSGTLLAQITPEGDFLLLANRLAHNRAKDTRPFRATDPYDLNKRGGGATAPSTPAHDKITKSPFASPLARPVQDSSLLHTALLEKSTLTTTSSSSSTLPQPPPTTSTTSTKFDPDKTPEQLKEEIELFCSSPQKLKSFYDTAFLLQQSLPAPSPSPGINIMPGTVAEHNIPSLGLPPAITLQGASPATTPGWGGLVGGLVVGGTTTPRGEGGLGAGGMSVFGKRVGVGEEVRGAGGGAGDLGAGSGSGKRASVEGGVVGSLGGGVPKRQNSHESTGSGQGD